ncbi:MAG: M48 family metallopeptidase [Candidatus Falkowbacteria bacterium]
MTKRLIKLNHQDIAYELKNSRQARSMRLEISPKGLVVVKPVFVPFIFIEQFIKTKADWIIKNLSNIQPETESPVIPPEELIILKRRAAHLILARLEFFNQQYGFKYRSVSIRNQKTRWGSCSQKGALNFNCRLALLPAELLDYVAVHELCHLKEMNHSFRFWHLVSRAIPDYQKRREELKKYRSS